jgi:hypothetical protein
LFAELNIAPKSPISEWTARRWLIKLGWRRTVVRKGVYMDGHEQEDVVDYWNKVFFLHSRSLRSVWQNMRGLIWIQRESSQKFERLCQSWKKVSEESSFNIMTSAASMPMMMPETYGESFH